jgi:hypothetical protein
MTKTDEPGVYKRGKRYAYTYRKRGREPRAPRLRPGDSSTRPRPTPPAGSIATPLGLTFGE